MDQEQNKKERKKKQKEKEKEAEKQSRKPQKTTTTQQPVLTFVIVCFLKFFLFNFWPFLKQKQTRRNKKIRPFFISESENKKQKIFVFFLFSKIFFFLFTFQVYKKKKKVAFFSYLCVKKNNENLPLFIKL